MTHADGIDTSSDSATEPGSGAFCDALIESISAGSGSPERR